MTPLYSFALFCSWELLSWLGSICDLNTTARPVSSIIKVCVTLRTEMGFNQDQYTGIIYANRNSEYINSFSHKIQSF
jgi:hypothetical protein